jgi:hypothetical protein
LSEDFEKERLAIAQNSVEKASREYEPNNPRKIIPILKEGFQAVTKIGQSSIYPKFGSDKSNPQNLAEQTKLYNAGLINIRKEREFSEAIKLASGIRVDALADKEIVAADESVFITSRVFFPSTENIKVKEIKLQTPNDWQISKADAPKETTQGFFPPGSR